MRTSKLTGRVASKAAFVVLFMLIAAPAAVAATKHDFSFHFNPNNSEPDGGGTETTPPHIDVLFLLDSTGSMDDEIQVVKDKIEQIMFEVENGTPKPVVRYAIVTYRDRGDVYVTRLLDFTENVENIKTFLRSIQADGGADGPESVNEALHVAINNCSWGGDDHVKMIFLIGDAPPHMDYENDYDYRNEVEIAKAEGIKIYVIGCSGITGYGNGVSIFNEIAEKTGGTYQELIYTAGEDSYPTHDGPTCAPPTEPPIEHDEPAFVSLENVPMAFDNTSTPTWTACSPATCPTACKCCCGGSTESPIRRKSGNCYSNILDVQLTYSIQQVAIQNGVSYKNAVSVDLVQ